MYTNNTNEHQYSTYGANASVVVQDNQITSRLNGVRADGSYSSFRQSRFHVFTHFAAWPVAYTRLSS